MLERIASRNTLAYYHKKTYNIGPRFKEYLQNTDPLQLFTINIKTDGLYKSNKNAKLRSLGRETCWSDSLRDGAQELKVICAGLPNESRE